MSGFLEDDEFISKLRKYYNPLSIRLATLAIWLVCELLCSLVIGAILGLTACVDR
jgi:hypothetical protein